MTLQNIKISLRTDQLANWQQYDPVLHDGEVAIVKDQSEGIVRFKVGDGSSTFSQLQYVNQAKVITNLLDANAIQTQHFSQGVNVDSSPFGFAAGIFLSAAANFSQVLGINAQAQSGNDYSFVWNGDDVSAIGEYYQAHGKGSFNINPLSGLSGIFVGKHSLAYILDNSISGKQDALTSVQLSAIDSGITSEKVQKYDSYESQISSKADISSVPLSVSELANDVGYIVLSDVVIPSDLSSFTNSPGYVLSSQLSNELSTLSSKVDGKITIDDRLSGISTQTDLSIIKLSADDYAQLVANDQTISNCLYILENEFEDAYGQQIKNVAKATDLSDAVILEQLNDVSSSIPINVSQLSNDAGYTTNVGTITGITMNGASKGTSGVVDLGTVLTAHQDLNDYYTKSQTSSASQISDAIPTKTSQLSNDSGFIALSDVSIPTDLSSFTNSPGYISSVPDSYKTYQATVSSLSNDGYALSSSLTSFYIKSETSSAQEIASGLSSAQKGYTVTIRHQVDDGAGEGWAYVGGCKFDATDSDQTMRIQDVETSMSEAQLHGQTLIVVPNQGLGQVYVNGVNVNNQVIQLTSDTLLELYTLLCFVEGTLVTLANGSQKLVEQVTKDDVLKVWDFDEGKFNDAKPIWLNNPNFTTYYWETKLQSGKSIKTAGVHGHRFFSLDQNKFIYADEIEGHKIWTEDGEDIVVSSKLVQDVNVKFYNIITDRHINIFANRILAGCSIENGLYNIENMKFVKDGRKLRDFSEFEGEVSREWFDSCRYAESNLSRRYLVVYFRQRNPGFNAKRMSFKAGDQPLNPNYINLHQYKLANVGSPELSSDVTTYALIQNSLGSIALSSFQNLPQLNYSVKSIVDALSAFINIFKGVQQ